MPGRRRSATVTRFAKLAKTDPSQKVRLSLASALQRLPLDERWAIAEPLASHAEDASDRVLPSDDLVWSRAAWCRPIVRGPSAWAARCQIPIVRRYVARRAVSADPAAGLAAVVSLLKTADDSVCVDLLIGTHDALRGRKHVARPEGWPAAFARLVARPDPNRGRAIPAAGARPRGAEGRRGAAADRSRPSDAAGPPQACALSALVERRVPGLAPDLHALLDDPALRGPALRALAAYDDPATPEIVLRRYGEYSASERDDAIATLAARPAWALALARGRRAWASSPPRRERLDRPPVTSLRRSADQRAPRNRLGQSPADLESKSRPGGQVQGSARLRSGSSRPTRREGGPSSTAPALRATGSTTPAATSAPS